MGTGSSTQKQAAIRNIPRVTSPAKFKPGMSKNHGIRKPAKPNPIPTIFLVVMFRSGPLPPQCIGSAFLGAAHPTHRPRQD